MDGRSSGCRKPTLPTWLPPYRRHGGPSRLLVLTSVLDGFQQLPQLPQPLFCRLRAAQGKLLEDQAVKCAEDKVSQVTIIDPGCAQSPVDRIAVGLIDDVDIVLEFGTAPRLEDELVL